MATTEAVYSRGWTEELPVNAQHEYVSPSFNPLFIYTKTRHPYLDPMPYRVAQTYAGNVVLITGASRGIGQETALEYVRCGASVVLVARTEAALLDVKNLIQAEVPTAKVLVFAADVRDAKAVGDAVRGAVEEFGRIDIAIANAGRAQAFEKPIVERDPNDWWTTVEINMRGTFNLAHFALPELSKTKGYFIIVGSLAAQLRLPHSSDYSISKFALNRLNEFIHAEHPEVKTISLHPGAIMTELMQGIPQLHTYAVDTLQLPACAMLRLTSGREDWLNGRYYCVNWDLDAIEKEWKDKVVEEDGLVNRMTIPAKTSTLVVAAS